MIDPTMFTREDFQGYLDQPVACWMGFGLQCVDSLQAAGVQVGPLQVDMLVARVVAMITEQTSGKLSQDRAATFTHGLCAGLLRERKTHDE